MLKDFSASFPANLFDEFADAIYDATTATIIIPMLMDSLPRDYWGWYLYRRRVAVLGD